MKAITSALIAASLFVAAPAIAAHEGHEGRVLDDEPAGKVDATSCPADAGQLADYMLGNLQLQMAAIREADDPDERQRLLRNHLQTMQEVLELLESRTGPPPQTARGTRQDKGTGPGAMMRGSTMHRSLEQRVDRLQKLLEQMIEHEQAEGNDEQG
jgi:hypothetical protein